MCTQLVIRAQISEWGFPRCVCSSALAQNGGHTQRFLTIFLKSSRMTYAQFLIFLNIHQHRSSDNFFSKIICKTDFKIFFGIPFFDIFFDIQKTLLQIFVLTCKNVYFYPKLKW